MLLERNPGWSHQLQELPETAAHASETHAHGQNPVLQVLEQLERQGWPAAPPVIAGSLYLIGDLLASGALHFLPSPNIRERTDR